MDNNGIEEQDVELMRFNMNLNRDLQKQKLIYQE